MMRGECFRELDRYYGIRRTMEQHTRMREIGKRVVLFCIDHELEPEQNLTILGVMIDGHDPGLLPLVEFLGSESLTPTVKEVECGRKKDQFHDFGVFGSEQSGEISTHARTDQNGR